MEQLMLPVTFFCGGPSCRLQTVEKGMFAEASLGTQLKWQRVRVHAEPVNMIRSQYLVNKATAWVSEMAGIKIICVLWGLNPRVETTPAPKAGALTTRPKTLALVRP